jgi:anti-sigma factor RsiW
MCDQIQASFSAYLDGAISGQEMQQIARHLEGFTDPETGVPTLACQNCAREFAAWRETQTVLSSLGPAKPPADLGLKLRLAISREHARRSVRLLDRLSLAWDNAIRPVMVQVSAGVAATTILVGGIMVLLGAVAPASSNPVLADDEPLAGISQPHYLYSTVAPEAIVCSHDAPIIVEALVDATGRVYDYSIVSGPEDQSVHQQIASQLLGDVFQPATVFGAPVRGRVVVTFSGISVRA